MKSFIEDLLMVSKGSGMGRLYVEDCVSRFVQRKVFLHSAEKIEEKHTLMLVKTCPRVFRTIHACYRIVCGEN